MPETTLAQEEAADRVIIAAGMDTDDGDALEDLGSSCHIMSHFPEEA